VTTEDISRHFECAGLARQKTPERLIEIDEFPRTPSGKVIKADLRSRLVEKNVQAGNAGSQHTGGSVRHG
jgi:non-ribosomal peptide synthetase component E (peptide arylation enzyme)